MTWAGKYQEQQEKVEREKMTMAEEHHKEKISLLSRLVNALESR